MRAFPRLALFTDCYVCTVWDQHPEVGEEILLEMFSRLPYLTSTDLEYGSLAEMQRGEAGVERRLEVSSGSFVVPRCCNAAPGWSPCCTSGWPGRCNR